VQQLVTVVVLALVVVAGTGVDAAVICQKKSGTMVIRESCRKKEVQVDLSAFGAVGPQGAPGERGPEGPSGERGEPGEAGTARAYACSFSADGTTVSFCSGRAAKNVTSVVANTTYPDSTCFVLDPSIDAASAVVVASLNTTSAYSGGKINALISADGFANYLGCPPNSVLVVTARHTNDGAFLGLEPTILGVNIAVM